MGAPHQRPHRDETCPEAEVSGTEAAEACDGLSLHRTGAAPQPVGAAVRKLRYSPSILNSPIKTDIGRSSKLSMN